MSEINAIANKQMPNTIETLVTELRALGLKERMVVIVHSSLSSLGWTSGGAVAVVEALMRVITEKGTIVMPTHSGELSEPSGWQAPPVPEAWWQVIRDTMPAFDPKVTPTRGMGKIVECFRSYENVKRSDHPQVSFAAWGKDADRITRHHQLAYGLGEGSPLQKIYDLDGHVLLLGVGHGNNTSLHLSENHAKVRPTFLTGAPIRSKDGRRVWQQFEEYESDEDEFEEIGRYFEEQQEICVGEVGNATAKLMKQKEIVDFGTSWLLKNCVKKS
ncbi:MAG: AAC(3) family N-acetyltransferase [Turicibacter sp.]|nr:AAC(3) family N-acetyltransferase [Turicibacter sp.]